MSIKILDCTLRDGAYVTNSEFGESSIRGIITQMQKAHADIIECGWLKDSECHSGSSFYHVPADVEPYLEGKNKDILYCVMIDWDRYNVENLPQYDGKSVDAIRVVFPHGRHKEGIAIGKRIREKGYKVLFQAANTLAYSEQELHELAMAMNDFEPCSLSVVDTFGAMYFEDLEKIVNVLDKTLSKKIAIGFHAHNNQQLAFALSIYFIEKLKEKRDVIVDATLCGMGRGAGNTTTELLANYINRNQHGNYDMNAIMDAIDIYMQKYQEKFSWGYSTPYFIAGMYQCHVNNIAYLLKNHRTNSRDLRTIIESLSTDERRKYDYDLLEEKYLENQDRLVDDSNSLKQLAGAFAGRKILLLAPGKSTITNQKEIKEFINSENPITIAVNAINKGYDCDYIFFTNKARYTYAKTAYPEQFEKLNKILLSNIKTDVSGNEKIINYNLVIKRGWNHFDNAVILCLRLMYKLNVKDVYIAGFDGFKHHYNESYADESLPTLNPDNKWDELNEEIKEIYRDFYDSVIGKMNITFVTESIFEVK
jgi:4-hydroxy 2-oxovalerate aldolase